MNPDSIPFIVFVIAAFGAFMVALGFGSLYAAMGDKSAKKA